MSTHYLGVQEYIRIKISSSLWSYDISSYFI